MIRFDDIEAQETPGALPGVSPKNQKKKFFTEN
jgi:hypothetical protein